MFIGIRAEEGSPLADKRVRQALNYGINVEQIVDDWLEGYGERYGSWVNPPWNNPELAPWPYDPDLARTLLAEAGYPDGGFDLLYTFATGDLDKLRQPAALPIGFRHTGDSLAFMGYDLLAAEIVAGDQLTLTTYWRALDKAPPSLTIFLHLLDSHSKVWAGWDGLDVSPYGWQRSDIIVQHIQLTVPADTPPGEYQLEIGLYTAEDGRRFVIFEGDEEVADRLLLRPIRVSE